MVTFQEKKKQIQVSTIRVCILSQTQPFASHPALNKRDGHNQNLKLRAVAVEVSKPVCDISLIRSMYHSLGSVIFVC